jgi:structural maintenance of chromosome 1
VLRRILFRLYHLEEAIDQHVREIQSQTKALASLREEQKEHEEALDVARKAQAAAKTAVMKKEREIKKAEKGLEIRVRFLPALY